MSVFVFVCVCGGRETLVGSTAHKQQDKDTRQHKSINFKQQAPASDATCSRFHTILGA